MLDAIAPIVFTTLAADDGRAADRVLASVRSPRSRLVITSTASSRAAA